MRWALSLSATEQFPYHFVIASSSSSSSSSASDSFSTMALYKSIYLHTYLLSSSSSSITKITFSLYINLCDRNQQTHTQKRTVKILSL